MGILDRIREKVFHKDSGIGSDEIGMKNDILMPEDLNPAYRDIPGHDKPPGHGEMGGQIQRGQQSLHSDPASVLGLGEPLGENPLAERKPVGSRSRFPDQSNESSIEQILEVIRSQNELILQKLNLIEQKLRSLRL